MYHVPFYPRKAKLGDSLLVPICPSRDYNRRAKVPRLEILVIRLDEVNHSTPSASSSAHNSTATMPVVKGGVWTNVEDEILKASGGENP